MRFELPIILALVAQLAQSSPVLDNNLQARTVEDGRKHPNVAERQECTDYCAKKHPGRVPGRQSKVKPEQRAH
ncbi:hypothetical protein MCOR27_003854 [Pyricularia oryzae]|uniref:Uncharacterized protein n=1 Tax=Pyricularia oryzae TaxID=318829 RepID=A0A4P7MYV5_PYROR|nr:hypothetical protein MCOR26_009183 [Pyricularia oryzae]KAI6282266.1 hypothetical protein MCOR27_003854 [Pyricularia oryzae]KAI6317818.1 hypothetical protein MCOR29_006170 [Pyricularia oryzae]KAI6382151.1 hypothetical protein MCOR32_003224 [Pyricularia oryzae]KAI6438711.1 hypothetical protein MCOR22_008579 [Pyricularia oryzae]